MPSRSKPKKRRQSEQSTTSDDPVVLAAEHENGTARTPQQENGTNEADTTVQIPEFTQVELFDQLRRIGELEDQKAMLQTEIDHCVAQLRRAAPTLDRDSLLYRMLRAAVLDER